jgi:hypothetical protein
MSLSGSLSFTDSTNIKHTLEHVPYNDCLSYLKTYMLHKHMRPSDAKNITFNAYPVLFDAAEAVHLWPAGYDI